MPWRALPLATFALALIAASTAGAQPTNTDGQLWTELDVEAPLTSRVAVSGLAVVRIGDGAPNPSVAGAGGALSYALSPHWSVSAGDYWIRVRGASSGRSVDLQLPLIALTYATQLYGFAFSDRNRAERIIGAPGDIWRYRNQLLASHPVNLGVVRSVFASDEIFYDASRACVSRNRAQLGLGLAPLGAAALQLYVLRQDDRFSRPGHLNVLGVTFAVKL